jgi:hypothetical protein
MIELKATYSHLDRLKKDFYNELEDKKYEITSWCKNPIKMDLFLSFLIVPVERSRSHLGSQNGWTQRFNKEVGLIIKGGETSEGELLDSIQFGEKLSNSYNNYVNPFYIFHLLNKEGQAFFVNYYKEDIEKIISKQLSKIVSLEEQLQKADFFLKTITAEYGDLKEMII